MSKKGYNIEIKRICKTCGKEYLRNNKYSNKQWKESKFCSYKCNNNFKIWRQTGGIPWNKNKHIQLNDALKKWRKNGGINWNKGKKGCYKLSELTKRKISEANKGGNSGSFKKGIHYSSKTEFKKGQFRLEKHPNWQGGKSFEPYTVDWTETLKQSIRERDKYTCQICNIEPAIDCHHIDYNKKNCNPENLIILCRSCHTKTNQNRNYWINYFNEFLF